MRKAKISKQIIVDTAVLLADRDGFYNITLKDIAEYLEIKTPSLYNHIDGMGELYDSMAQEGLKQLLSALTESVIGFSGRDALTSMGAAYIRFATSAPSLYYAAQRVPIWKNEATKELAESVVGLIIKLIAVYEFTEEQNIHIVRALRSYLHGFALLKSQDSFGMPVDIDRSFELGFTGLLDGMQLY